MLQAWVRGSVALLRRHDRHLSQLQLSLLRAQPQASTAHSLQVRQHYGVTIDRGFKPTSNARLAATFSETKKFADALRIYDKQVSAQLQAIKGEMFSSSARTLSVSCPWATGAEWSCLPHLPKCSPGLVRAPPSPVTTSCTETAGYTAIHLHVRTRGRAAHWDRLLNARGARPLVTRALPVTTRHPLQISTSSRKCSWHSMCLECTRK